MRPHLKKTRKQRIRQPRIPHDNSYKLLFSFPAMVRDLLTGFVNQPWLAELDLDTLEHVNGSYVTDDLRHLEDDIIWRVRFRGRWLYLYLLLEFQSSVDNFMAVRILTYLGLLYQDIVKQGELSEAGKLPPVLPIVLYNGKPRWHAATDIADLIESPPGQLRDYLPHLKYLLLDEGAIDESAPWALKNLVAALFRLEKITTPEAMLQVVSGLVEWLSDPAQAALRRAFVVWIKRGILPARLTGIEVPNLTDLLEVKTMLSETVIEWTQQWKQQGVQEGMEIGLKIGEASILERQIATRFGALNEEVRYRLNNASTRQLETWSTRIFDAPDLESLFNVH